jgi:hypothetical protein
MTNTSSGRAGVGADVNYFLARGSDLLFAPWAAFTQAAMSSRHRAVSSSVPKNYLPRVCAEKGTQPSNSKAAKGISKGTQPSNRAFFEEREDCRSRKMLRNRLMCN